MKDTTNKFPNFWAQFDKSKPFTVLAPMDDVTDYVFRRIVCDTYRPDVFFTEFTNCDALFYEGRISQIKRLKFDEAQHPIVAQVWGLTPENYFKTAQLVKEMGFDGIDINMGCPEKTVVKNGACSALIKNHTLAEEIIKAVKDGSGGLPVSVKTRIGFSKSQIDDWIGFLLGFDLEALTIHGRTVSQMSKVPADWNEIKKVVDLKDKVNKSTVIIGNGDVRNYSEAVEKHKESGVDGVMIGRGIFNDLWAFDPSSSSDKVWSIKDRADMLLKHCRLFDETWGETKNFEIMKKFFKIYINNFEGASDFRVNLMTAKTLKDVEKIVYNHFYV